MSFLIVLFASVLLYLHYTPVLILSSPPRLRKIRSPRPKKVRFCAVDVFLTFFFPPRSRIFFYFFSFFSFFHFFCVKQWQPTSPIVKCVKCDKTAFYAERVEVEGQVRLVKVFVCICACLWVHIYLFIYFYNIISLVHTDLPQGLHALCPLQMRAHARQLRGCRWRALLQAAF